MANTKKAPVTPITDADIEALQDVLSNLKAGAKDANEKGNITTFRVYKRLVTMVSPEVQKALARKEREEQARMNKDLQALKDRQNGASNGTGDAANATA